MVAVRVHLEHDRAVLERIRLGAGGKRAGQNKASAAKLREKRAVEEMNEAKELLSEQRVKFVATRQELTAEVIAYQRDLDEMTSEKKTLAADLAA